MPIGIISLKNVGLNGWNISIVFHVEGLVSFLVLHFSLEISLNGCYPILAFREVDSQEHSFVGKDDLRGLSMDVVLQRYRKYLCGVHRKKNTIKSKMSGAKQFFEFVRGDISKDGIQDWLLWSNKRFKRNTVNNRINAVNQFLRWYGCPSEWSLKHIGFELTNQVALSESDMELLIDASKGDAESYLIVVALFDGILRPGEVINIRLGNRDGDRLFLDDTKTGNNSIVLSPRFRSAWDAYLKVRPVPNKGSEDFILVNTCRSDRGNRYLTCYALRRMLRLLARECGLGKSVTPYTVKRTSITLRQDKRSKYFAGDPKLVQRMARHKDLSTTMRYNCVDDDKVRSYFDALDKPERALSVEPQDKLPETLDKSVPALDKSYK